MADGKTPFWHQVRDQAAHVAMGLPAGLACDPEFWWAAPLLAMFYGAMREIKQWGQLNTPSLTDSIIDTTFVTVGGAVGMALRLFVIPGLMALFS